MWKFFESLFKKFKNLFISYFLFILTFIILNNHYGNLSKLSSETIVLILTAVAIVWYSFETLELKEIQKKSLELSVKPILNIFEGLNGNLYIKNVSDTFAKNIQIEDLFIIDKKFSFKLVKKFISNDGVSMPILIKDIETGNDLKNYRDIFYSFFFKSSIKIENIKIKVTCEDIFNNKHISYFEISNIQNLSDIKLNMIY